MGTGWGGRALMEQIAKKLFNWASILEDKTREQAEKTASMPFVWPHLALMPDAHLGKGATVGSVIPTLGAIRWAPAPTSSPASATRCRSTRRRTAQAASTAGR